MVVMGQEFPSSSVELRLQGICWGGACGHQLERCQLLPQLADGGLLVGGHPGHYGMRKESS